MEQAYRKNSRNISSLTMIGLLMEELMAKILEKSGYTIPAKGSDFQNQWPVDLIANNSENLVTIQSSPNFHKVENKIRL